MKKAVGEFRGGSEGERRVASWARSVNVRGRKGGRTKDGKQPQGGKVVWAMELPGTGRYY